MGMVLRGLRQGVYTGGFRMTTNKDIVIDALIFKFAPLHGKYPSDEGDLIRASCDNVYQSGYLQGRHDALMEYLKALKGEVKP